MKTRFIEWNPTINSRKLLVHIDAILKKYEEQGYKLTLRQLYYQLVSRDIIANNVNEYNKLGNVVSKGRLSGYIDWDMIEDRTRFPRANSHWNSPEEIIDSAAHSYYESRWENQDSYIEVWCEKDAVSNILQPVCSRWDVLFMANRGYSSQSAMYEAYRRLALKVGQEDKEMRIIYLGDHDPSGLDMIRDIADRLGTFIFKDAKKSIPNVSHIALTRDQIDEYNPPKNPAKVTDTRFERYSKEHGESSWELDALEPKVLEAVLENAIKEYVDEDEFERVAMEELEKKDKIRKLAEMYKEIE